MAQKKLEEMKAAAVKIQATYRGFSTRKCLRNQREMELEPMSIVSDLLEEIVFGCLEDEVLLR